MTTNSRSLTYFQYVNILVRQFPRLQLLVDFMSSNIKISGYHNEENVNQRLRNVNVNVVEVGLPATTCRSFDNIEGLSQHLNTKQHSECTRIILVENLSATVIELLGSKFGLDPRFFENHVRGIQKFLADSWDGDQTERLESSISDVLKREFLLLKFARLYVLSSWKTAWELRMKLNIPRWGNSVRSLFLHESASVYGPIKIGENSATFIVLCDPLLHDAVPHGMHLRNNDPLPAFDSMSQCSIEQPDRKQISTRSALEKALLRTQSVDVETIKILLIGTIITTALDFHAAAIYELALRRYRFNSNYSSRPRESYKSMLEKLNLSGGWINLHEDISKSIVNIKNIGIRSLPDGEIKASLNLEIDALEAAHAKVDRHKNHVLEFLRSEQEINFTRSVERLTTIAFLFLPFSTIATILSIDDTMRFGVFFALAVPILVICVAFGIHGTSLENMLTELGTLRRKTFFFFRGMVGTDRPGLTTSVHDVEATLNSIGELQNLYEKVSEAISGHDEKSMSSLISEVQARPSLRRRHSTRSTAPAL